MAVTRFLGYLTWANCEPRTPSPGGGIMSIRFQKFFDMHQGEADGRWSQATDGQRKVRAPQGRMLGNAQGRQLHGQCHREETACLRQVRVKR